MEKIYIVSFMPEDRKRENEMKSCRTRRSKSGGTSRGAFSEAITLLPLD